MNAQDVLQKFAEYINYQQLKEQKTFNLFTSSYEFKRIGEKIEALVHFDPSGSIAAIYASEAFKSVMSSCQCNVLDLLEQPDALGRETEMYQCFSSPSLRAISEQYIEDINAAMQALAGKNMLGDRNKEEELKEFADIISVFADNIGKLSIDVYLSSGQRMNPTTNILPEILVFDTTAEALLSIENSADGVYTTYISNRYTVEGYFSVFVKSNGNIVAYHDRINEAFKGAHSGSRNARWTEYHAEGIFPYGYIFEYGDYDHKGYATTYRIDPSKLKLAEQPPGAYIPLIILMVTLGKYAGCADIEAPTVYVDSLAAAPLLCGSKATDLTVYGNSQVIKQAKSLNFTFEKKKILDGTYGREFGGHLVQNQNTEYLISGYGMDFEPDMNKAMYPDAVEMIATENALRKETYRLIRVQLHDHIARKMERIFSEAGGLDGVRQWYTAKADELREQLTINMAKAYLQMPVGCLDTLNYDPEERSCVCVYSKDFASEECLRSTVFRVTEDKYPPLHSHVLNKRHPGSRAKHDWQYACPVTGNRPTIWVSFRPSDWIQIEALFGEEVPEFLKGFRTKTIYSGNSILQATDSCNDLYNPIGIDQHIEYDRAGIEGYKSSRKSVGLPDITIGFSKRGVKAMLKNI